MRSRTTMVLIPVLFFPLTLCVESASATLYCNRPYTELTQNPGKPYNAVGYLNNGCTAFLIDSDHIVAAAHCFEDTSTGAWQTGLRFYPNFHPDRVVADDMHVPRGTVTRVVVGSRAGESVLGSGMDWGIARIDNWTDTAGLDLTPVALASSVPATGTALVNPAYTRHHFPYNDNDFVTWDNMQWDTAQCGWVGSNHGVWAILMRTAPFFNSVNRDLVGCNSRWGSGMIHADCSLKQVVDDVLVHNCDGIGGSSGSPILYQNGGNWSVIGVQHGGGSPATAAANDFSLLAPACATDTADHWDNVAASVERFRYAPRFASNVAVARTPNNASATAIFAVDSDSNRVVYRARTGWFPTYTSNFSFWQSLGTPYAGAHLTRVAACSADSSGRPQVFVVADNTTIYTRSVLSGGLWGSWSSFGIGGAEGSVVDIDAASDANGRCELFMVANGGKAYARTKTSDTAWGFWTTVAIGSYKSITSLMYAGTLWATMIDGAGDIWRTSLGVSGWDTPIKLTRPAGVTAWLDLDMTWDEAGRGFMIAIPTNATNQLRFLPMYGAQAWTGWRYFETRLWAPWAAVPPDAPVMKSITASRWMEDPPGTTSPVIFATDDKGSVNFIEYARIGTPGWVLDWKSFYHEYIPYTGCTRWWCSATDVGSGWRWSDWLGFFNVNGDPWIYHQQLGWLYISGTSPSDVWIYHPGMAAWLWTSNTVFPFLYRASGASPAWLYYLEWTTGPAWFHNQTTDAWEAY